MSTIMVRDRGTRGPHTAVVIAGIVALCGGCAARGGGTRPREPKRVASQAEAGAVHVAVTYVAPWEELMDRLQPAFPMDEKRALQSVLPSTQNVTEKFLDAFGARARVAAPMTSVTSQSTRTRDDDTTHTSSSRTETRAPGNVSAVASAPAPAGSRTAATTPGLDVSSEPLGVDPILQHTAATALFQEIALLNTAVQRAALRYRYVPYVVRVQISLMPRARDLPYDAYSTLSFFSGGATQPSPVTKRAEEPVTRRLPYVIPLLVTDNLEGALHSSSDDVVRQLGFGLNLLLGGFGADLDLQKANEALRSRVGRDLTSVQTVGRLADNSLRVRLGATPQGELKARHAMTPRTHNVTLVVLAPVELVRSPEPTVRLATRTTLVDVESGLELRARTDKEVQAALYDTLTHPRVIPAGTRPGDAAGAARELITSIQQSRFDLFSQRVDALNSEHGWTIAFPDSLWVSLLSVAVGGQFATASFDLPKPPRPRIPAQTALLLDDAEKEAVVTLAGVSGVRPERTRATLRFHAGREYELPALRTSYESGRLTLAFASPAAWGAEPSPAARLELEVNVARDEWRSTPSLLGWRADSVRYQKKPPRPVAVDPGFTLAVKTQGIVPVGDSAFLDVYVDIGEVELQDKDKKVPAADKVEITVEGMDFALQAAEPADSAARVPATNKLEVVKDSRLTLKLTNVAEGKRLLLTSRNPATKIRHADVEVAVLRPVGASK